MHETCNLRVAVQDERRCDRRRDGLSSECLSPRAASAGASSSGRTLPGWLPHPGTFFTCIVTFDALPGGKTNYTARALHWTVENRVKHEEMGFHHGWGESLDRLVALVTQ